MQSCTKTGAVSHKSIFELQWLSPTKHIIAAPTGGEAQDCILSCYLVAWAERGVVSFWSAWAAEIPDHAALRFLQRAHNDAGALREALFAAGVAFMATDAASVLRATPPVYLPVPGGAFVGEPIHAVAGERRFTYFRGKTFFTAAMLGPDQIPLPAATDPDKSMMLMLWNTRARTAQLVPDQQHHEPMRCALCASTFVRTVPTPPMSAFGGKADVTRSSK